MTPEEKQWHPGIVKERFAYLQLSDHQAEKIVAYEQDRDSYYSKHYLTYWEAQDYELTTFQEILDQQQFATYLSFFREQMRQYEESLIEQDKQMNEMAYQEDLLHFIDTQFLPDVRKDPFFSFGWLFAERVKIDYLRAVYKNFLHETKQEILVNHFRNYRTFKPNELKASLLRHKVTCILPDYFRFQLYMDEPTKAIAQLLLAKLQQFPEEIEKLIVRKFDELQVFHKRNADQHHGNGGGWHVVITTSTAEEEREFRLMTLVLMDQKRYDLHGPE